MLTSKTDEEPECLSNVKEVDDIFVLQFDPSQIDNGFILVFNLCIQELTRLWLQKDSRNKMMLPNVSHYSASGREYCTVPTWLLSVPEHDFSSIILQMTYTWSNKILGSVKSTCIDNGIHSYLSELQCFSWYKTYYNQLRLIYMSPCLKCWETCHDEWHNI